MADDVLIEATAGPYAGQRLTLPAADAKKAIADGWARDPFAEPEEPKDMTDEARAKVAEAAEKAARKLRGEDDAAKDKSLEADKPAASYETRSTTKAKK